MRKQTPATLAFALLALSSLPVRAQYLTPNTGGTIGGACTNGTFTWPDSSGYFLKCVSGAWVKLSSPTSNYAGSICQTPATGAWSNDQRGSFAQSIDAYGTATCAQPHAYSAFSGNTNNAQTAASTTYYFAVNGATSLQTTDTAAITRSEVSRAGTIQNLYVVADVANSAGKTNTYTVMKTVRRKRSPVRLRTHRVVMTRPIASAFQPATKSALSL
jgi:hypothetical protein